MTTVHVATAEGLSSVGSETGSELEGRDVSSLIERDGTWWAIGDGAAVLRSRGDDWQEVARSDGDRLNCLLAAHGRLLVGASDARLLELVDAELVVVESFEGAEGRAAWYTPWGGPPDVRTLAADEHSIYANVHVGGILRERDDRWVQTIDIDSDVHQVVAADARILAATAWGLAISADGGDSWDFVDDGLHATYCRAVARCDDTVLLSASVGPHGGRAAIYRLNEATGAFAKCERGLPDWFGDNIDSGCLDAAGELAAFATSNGDVFLSGDSGASWDRIAAGLPPARAVVVRV